MYIFNGYRGSKLFAVRRDDDGHLMEEEWELTNIAYAVREAICNHLVLKEYRVDEVELYTVSLGRFPETPEKREAVKGITLIRTGERCVAIMRGSTMAGFATWRDETAFTDPVVDITLQ